MDYLSNRAMICLQKEVGGKDMTTERELIEDWERGKLPINLVLKR